MRSSNCYNLVRTIEEYSNKARITYNYTLKRPAIKTCKRIYLHNEKYDCDIPYQLDLESGEITPYDRVHHLFSKQVSRSRANREIMKLLDANEFTWFITLTFNNQVVNRHDDEAVYKIYKKWISKLRRKYSKMYFVTTVERHKAKEDEEDGCIHFHILMGGISANELQLADSGKVSCSWLKGKYSACNREYYEKTKHLHIQTITDGLTVYNIKDFYWGFSNVTIVQNQEAAKYYVKKYVNKDLDSAKTFKRNYYYSNNIQHPNIVKEIVNESYSKQSLSMIRYSDNYTKNAKSDYYSEKYFVRKIELDNTRYNLIKNGINICSEVKLNELNKNVLMPGAKKEILIPVDINVDEIF